MKKVKLMLLSLSVLAVVGGALAFTTKTGPKFCVASPDDESCIKGCQILASIKATSDPTAAICTASTNGNPNDPCNGVQCTTKRNSVVE